ncbi:hypothetical protein BG011_004723 [Mortierella polycephala]|uniref:Uncharacterized protein n=1 Tax=Mortierella polycephala TaxID=41804 RepID=A0A9P6PXK5_9FUNG|nr:hypothetical protein BG011_004723 [Mortierella polycephala]
MVYATRSRVLNKTQPAAATARVLGEQKQTPKKKRPTTTAAKRKAPPAKSLKSTRRASAPVISPVTTEDHKNTAKKTPPLHATASGGMEMTINSTDEHKAHNRDGKDHHVVEQDGRMHHHIWYKDFEENERADTNSNSGDIHLTQDIHQIHHGIAEGVVLGAPEPQPRARRSSKSSQSHASVRQYGPNSAPLTIHVDRTHRKHPLDGMDHHLIEADGRDHHHIRFSDNESSMGDSHDHGSLKASKFTSHSNAASTSHAMDALTTSTTTTSTTSTGHSLSTSPEHRRLHSKEEASVRLLTQKSQLDRTKAREAILNLDSDVLQLQKLLQEKEEALRTAEAEMTASRRTTTIRTEILTTEVNELRVLILDLRSSLQGKETALRDVRLEVEMVKKDDQTKIHTVEEYSHKVQEDLGRANKNSEMLAGQVKEMSKTLKTREQELQHTKSTVKNLERTKAKKTEEAQRLSNELAAVKMDKIKKQNELDMCHTQIKALENEHHKVETLDSQLQKLRHHLTERESSLKDVQKQNKSLNRDHIKAAKLTDEVKVLKRDIREAEDMLQKAQKAVDSLGVFRDRATLLQVEVHDLHDQINVLEKHETDLEDALMAHENCVIQSKELQDQINQLQAQLDEKQTEIQNLSLSKQLLHNQDESQITSMQAEMQILLADMRSKDQEAQKLKEKSAHDLTRINSVAGTLKIEILGLRQQLKDKNAALNSAGKSIKNLGAAQSQNETLAREVKKLEEKISVKDRHAAELDGVIASMTNQADRAAYQSAQDLAIASTTSLTLTAQIETLTKELSNKETTLHQVIERSSKDHEEGVHMVEEMSELAADLRLQLEHAKKDTEAAVKAKEGQIADIKMKLAAMEQHDEGLVSKMNDLNKEIDKETALLRQKEKTIQDIQRKLTEQTHEIGRLNAIVAQTRSEINEDRKRRASEIEESVLAQSQQLQQFQQIKTKLEQEIMELRNKNQELGKSVEVEHQHAVHEHELADQVQALLLWQQNSAAQTKEWENTVAALENERETQSKALSSYEREVLGLRTQLKEAEDWRQQANEQAEKISGVVSKLEKEQKLLKNVALQHDKIEAKANEKMLSFQCQIQSLQNERVMLMKDIDDKETDIDEMRTKLKEDSVFLKSKAAEIKKEVEAKERIIQTLNSRIAENERNAAVNKQTIIELQRQAVQMQQEFSAMEMRVKSELVTTMDLTSMLSQFRKSMKMDSEAELKKLDELESEIKNRSSIVEETIQITRNRMDSGAFLDHATHSPSTTSTATTDH